MTAELANFIKQHIDLINESEFDQLYQIANEKDVKTEELTALLLDSDIDFLSFMTKVPKWCFAKIKSLTSITIPESIQMIEDKAFSWCSNLESVKLANSITHIGEGAFYLCTSIKKIDYQGTKQQWMDIDKSPRWNRGMPYSKIVCLDGTIEYLELQK